MRYAVAVSAALHVGAVGLLATRDDVRAATANRDAIAIEIVEVPATPAVANPPATSADTPARPANDRVRAGQPRRAALAVAGATVAGSGSEARLEHGGPVQSSTRPDRRTANDAEIDHVRGAPSAPVAVGEDERAGEGPTRSRYLDMRRGAPPDLSLPARDEYVPPARETAGEAVVSATAREIGAPPASRPRATAHAAIDHRLSPHGDGARSDQGSFVAMVAPDGSVSFDDRSDVAARYVGPTPAIIGRGIAEWYTSDKGPDGKRGKQPLRQLAQGSIDAGAPHCEVRDNACMGDRSLTIIIPVVGGNFSPTDWIMRRTAGDPYGSKKRAWLDATREARGQMRADHRRRQLEQVTAAMRANLEAAWNSTHDATRRKQALFALWDEIAEPDGADPLFDEAVKRARDQVIGFIRARLPQRDEGAYSVEEIAVLNARRTSITPFTPYE